MKFFVKRRKNSARKTHNQHPKRFQVTSHINVLNNSDMQTLASEARILWNDFGGDRYSAKSFWIGRDEEPRCAIEAYAKACAAFHNPSFTGAEYWVQLREGKSRDGTSNKGLEFHFDKDEVSLATKDVWKHPHISTVTYLTTGTPLGGAPLIIFDTTSTGRRSISLYKHRIRSPATAICFPVPNSVIAFDGSLLHGVPSELNPVLYEDSEFTYERLSLPVNVWHEKPSGLTELPVTALNAILTKHRSCSPNFTTANTVLRIKLSSNDVYSSYVSCCSDNTLSQNSSNLYKLQEHVDGDTALLPIGIIKHHLQLLRSSSMSDMNSGKLSTGLVVKYRLQERR